MIADNFWAHVKKTKSCWLWTAGKAQGYGVFKLNGKIAKAYRHSWALANGPIPKGGWICHRCDNPPCVRPSHLFLGDRLANMHDMMEKGRARHLHGAGHPRPMAKLTNENVRQIKMMLLDGMSNQIIADKFSVDQSNISHIKRGFTWRHVCV